VIQETEELTNDTGLKINIHTIKYINTLKYKHKNMQPKTKNINEEDYKEVSELQYLCLLVT